MITFLITFLLMLLSGSIFILGFFTITRGKKIIMPNGEEEIEKEIFGGWQLFWESIERYKKVFYSGDQLEFKLKILEQLKPVYIGEVSFSTSDRKSLFFNFPLSDSEIRDIEFTLNTHIFKNGDVIFLYDEMPVYRFSKWVRKITNCYVCMSSWMGTFYYFTLLYFYPKVVIGTTQRIVFLIVFCISLSFVNKVIKENFDIDKK